MLDTVAPHEVIVIGAGHNGLIAANYLQDAGMSVAVFEQAEKVGGMTSSSRPFAAAPDHVVNDYAVDAFLWDAFPPATQLNLERYGLRRVAVEPGHVYLHPGGASIAFGNDVMQTADDIRRISPRDARGYLEFVELVEGMADAVVAVASSHPKRPTAGALLRVARGLIKSRKNISTLSMFPLASSREVIAERFEHQIVRDALHTACGSVVANSTPGTAAAFIWLATMHRFVSRRPIGGMQAIPDALAARLRAHGGRIETGAPCTEILVEGSAVRGVRLADGRVVRSSIVLAACDPKKALTRLLPDGALPEEVSARAKAISTDNSNYGNIKLDVAFSGRLGLDRFAKWRRDDIDLRQPSHMVGTEGGNQTAFARAAAGLPSDSSAQFVWPAIPSAADPTQAPEGQDVLYAFGIAPVRAEGGWDAALSEEAGNAVFEHLATFYEGMADYEIERRVLTPVDFAERTGATDGNCMHVDMVPSHVGPLRPARGLGGYSTPVAGLFLGSSGTHPGGAVTGAPGYLSAREVTRQRAAHTAWWRGGRFARAGH